MDAKNVLMMELMNLSPLQREIHFPSKEKPNEEIESRFFYHPRKISLTNNIESFLTMTREGPFWVYIADQNFHLLTWTALLWKLPEIRVKETYKDTVKISWPKNLGYHLIKEAGLYFGDIRIQYMDNVWLNIYLNLLDKRPNKREFLMKMIGNRRELNEWSDHLQESTLIVPQPWYYTESEVYAVPLFYCQQKQVKHKYVFRNKLNEILRMKVKKDNEWKKIDPLLSYLEITEDVISLPEMIGRYIHLTQEELEWRNRDNLTYYVRDVIRWVDEVPKSFSDSIVVDIQVSEPCQAIFFVAENIEKVKNRSFDRFTTSTGRNPFSHVKLIYGIHEKITERDIDIFDSLEPYYHFPCVPLKRGYNGMSFCYDLNAVDPDVGINFKGLSAKLILRMREENHRETFRVKVYFLVIKRIQIAFSSCIISDTIYQQDHQ